eukprot:SAG31_NODE_309_length_17949_cov_11.083361_7_plen_653_part_00
MAERRRAAAEPGGAHDAVDGSAQLPDSKRQRLCTAPPASLTLLAANDDASRHVVPRAAALGVSELLAEMLGAEAEQGAAGGELVLRVPTSGSATAAFAAFVHQRAAASDIAASTDPGPEQQPGQQLAPALEVPAAAAPSSALMKWKKARAGVMAPVIDKGAAANFFDRAKAQSSAASQQGGRLPVLSLGDLSTGEINRPSSPAVPTASSRMNAASKEAKGLPVQALTCREGHPLVRDPKPENYCDRCEELGVDTDGTTFRCDECDYDVCQSCSEIMWGALKIAFPAAEWRAAAFFMAAEWQGELSRAWGEAVIAATARADASAGLATAVLAADWAMDPNFSPLLTMLPAASLAAIYCALGASPSPVVEWVWRELGSPPRRADGWLLVASGDAQAVSSARAQATTSTTSTHVVVQHGVECIGYRAFAYWKSLASVAIPDSVTQIGFHAFAGCSSLASVAIPDSVTQIGKYAFEGCSSLASVAIPDSVTEIGERAFFRCSSLASVAIPDSVTEIDARVFYGCSSLASVAILDSVIEIGESAFCECSSLASVAIPDSVTVIGNDAFEGCSSLASVAIPDSVTVIGDRAFCGCSSLASVAIPDSVTWIGFRAFAGCSSLATHEKNALRAQFGDLIVDLFNDDDEEEEDDYWGRIGY